MYIEPIPNLQRGTEMHRVFRALAEEQLQINSVPHLIVHRISLEHPTGTSRALLWTESAQGAYFLMISGPNYFEPGILGYTPVGITAHEKGFTFQGDTYWPAYGEEDRWLDEQGQEAARIYECFTDTGADILVVELGGTVHGFAYRSRYNWQSVR